jgi:recombination protein RecA
VAGSTKDKPSARLRDDVAELFKKLRDAYGPNVIKLGSQVKPVRFRSTGIKSLDEIMGGGLPEGRIVELWGPKSAGKSSVLFGAIAAIQRDDPKAKIAYFDLENTYDATWAAQLGVATDKIVRVGAMYAEHVGDLVVAMVRRQWTLVAIDSIVGLLPGKELERSLDTATPGILAMMLSRILPKVIVLQGQSPTILVLVNQVRDNIGFMFGAGTKSPGGHALEHFDSLKVRVQRKDPIKKGDKQIGYEMALRVLKSKVGVEGRSCVVDFLWGKGFVERTS